MKKEWAPQLLSVLRIVVAFLYFQAPVGSLAWFAGVIEVVGGTFFFLGLFTRPVAFILSGEMAFAYFIGHFPNGVWPVLNQGAPAVFYCFTFLYYSAAGAGPWSLDALLARRRGTVPVL